MLTFLLQIVTLLLLLNILICFQKFRSPKITISSCRISSSNEIHLSSDVNTSNFDSEFADAFAKPLPDWFLEQEVARKKLHQEMEEKSKKMLDEFKAKYILSEIEKAEVAKKIRESKKQKRQISQNWLSSIFKKASTVIDSEEDLDNEELTTREKWQIFLREEEKATGFSLPGFFDVFPELKFKWPVWAKRNGKAIKCEVDGDCQFPQACCSHPIIPGDKFCCTGWGRRIMVPAYQHQMIQPQSPSK